MANLKDVIYISNEDYATLVSTGTVTIDGTTLTYDENCVYITPETLASTTADGLMSAVDKVKLNSLDDSNLVHKTGTETISGEKTFTGGTIFNSYGTNFYLGADKYGSELIYAPDNSCILVENENDYSLIKVESDGKLGLYNLRTPTSNTDAATKQYVDSKADNDHYPTTFTWTNGTTSGPTGSLTGNTGFSAVSFGAIPSASASQSGVVTTGTQTFTGSKTFDTTLTTRKIIPVDSGGYEIGDSTHIYGGVTTSYLKHPTYNTLLYVPFITQSGDITIPGTSAKYVYNSQLDDAFWDMGKRYYVIVSVHPKVVNGVTYPYEDTNKQISDDDYIVDSTPINTINSVDHASIVHQLFDGSPDTGDATINRGRASADNYIKIRIIPLATKQDNYSPSSSTSTFPGYPYGKFILTTYYGDNATEVMYATYNKHSSWPTGWYIANGVKGNDDRLWTVDDAGHYSRTEMDFWFIGDGDSTKYIRPTSLYWIKNRVTDISNENSYFSKYIDEELVNSIVWRDRGVQKAKIQPDGVAQFTTIYESGSLLSDKYLGKTAKAVDADKLDGQDSTYYLDYNNLTNKPTIPSDSNLVHKGTSISASNEDIYGLKTFKTPFASSYTNVGVKAEHTSGAATLTAVLNAGGLTTTYDDSSIHLSTKYSATNIEVNKDTSSPSTLYTLSFPAKSGTIATTDDIPTIPTITVTQAMITGYGTGGAPYYNPWYRFNFGANNQYLINDKYDTIKLDITAIRSALGIPTDYLYLKRNATNSDQGITLYQFFIDDSGFDYSHIQDQDPYVQIGQIGDAALIYEPTSGAGWLTNRNINPTDIYGRIAAVETDKLDKVTSTSSAGSRVYAVNTSGNQEMILASSNANTAYSIVRRNSDLGVTVPQTPINNTDAASKSYVDGRTPNITTEDYAIGPKLTVYINSEVNAVMKTYYRIYDGADSTGTLVYESNVSNVTPSPQAVKITSGHFYIDCKSQSGVWWWGMFDSVSSGISNNTTVFGIDSDNSHGAFKGDISSTSVIYISMSWDD